jgi:hypothetical protein
MDSRRRDDLQCLEKLETCGQNRGQNYGVYLWESLEYYRVVAVVVV